MVAIKSFTDLSQSKTLSTILPLESADMKILPFTEREYRIVPINDISVCGREDEIYAWSLAALLNILPYPALCKKSDNTWGVDVWVDNKLYCTYASYKIDACYEMILKLHKLNLLGL